MNAIRGRTVVRASELVLCKQHRTASSRTGEQAAAPDSKQQHRTASSYTGEQAAAPDSIKFGSNAIMEISSFHYRLSRSHFGCS